MLPSHLIMLGRARLETVNAGHSEVRRQRKAVETKEMIKLLHLRKVQIKQISFRREIFHRQTRLNAIIRPMMLWAIGHPMHPHLHREFRRYTQQVVIINRYLIHRLMPYPHLLTLRNQIVDFIRIFHSPTCMIEVLQRIAKVRRHVERLDTAMYISVRILFYLSHISAVGMGRIKYRCRISQSTLLCGKRELIGLIVPTQY